MEEKEIVEINALFAEFIGYKKELFYQCSPDEDKSNWEDKDFGFYNLPFEGGYDMVGKEGIWFAQTLLKFHLSWDWLHPVWKEFVNRMKVHIDNHNSPVEWMFNHHKVKMEVAFMNSDLQLAHYHLSQIIKWYNQFDWTVEESDLKEQINDQFSKK